mmetsp:Transcript_106303/g.189029  ORF Transcript_106303/g.189029 Transcript_106303/m.189029 type:complete len:129 (-) Transcript_106303:43-429(-)
MGENLSCSTQCAPNCISRQHPPGAEPPVDDAPMGRKNVGRTYPVADPVDIHLNWQTIAVRHAWKKAAEMGEPGPDSARFEDNELVQAGVLPVPTVATAEVLPSAPPFASPKASAEVRSDQQGVDVVKI